MNSNQKISRRLRAILMAISFVPFIIIGCGGGGGGGNGGGNNAGGAASGTLNTNFGAGGVLNLNAQGAIFAAAQVNPENNRVFRNETKSVHTFVDGGTVKLVFIGETTNGVNRDFFVAMTDTTGALDPAFNGGATLRGGQNLANVGRGFVDAQGNIFITAGTGTQMFAIVLDKTGATLQGPQTFNGEGASNAQGNAILERADNTILITGNNNNSNGNINIWKFNANLTADNTFGGDGSVEFDNAGGAEQGLDIAEDSGNNIYVCGISNDGDNDMIVLKVDANGANPANVEGAEIAAGQAEQGNGILIDENGGRQRVVVAGTANDGNDNEATLWSFDFNLAVDNTFDADGRFENDGAAGVTNSNDTATDLTTDGTNYFVSGDSVNAGNNRDAAVWSLEAANGALDNNFNTDGRATFGSLADANVANNDSFNSIVIAGGNLTFGGTSIDTALDDVAIGAQVND